MTVTVTASYCPFCDHKLGVNLHHRIGTPEITCRGCGRTVVTARREWDDRSIFDKLLHGITWSIPIVGQLLLLFNLFFILPSIRRTKQRDGRRPRLLLRHIALGVLALIAGAIILRHVRQTGV